MRLALREIAPAQGRRPRPRRVSGPAQAGILEWTDRAAAIIAMAAFLGSLMFAADQLPHLNKLWLGLVGGGLLATGALMPVYAWGQRGVRIPATLFAATVAVGLVSWPFAWDGGAAVQAPWFWPCIGAAAVVLCVGWNTAAATVAAVLSSAIYLVVRITPSGGQLAPVVAIQDALLVGVQPLLIALLFAYLRRQSALVDDRLGEARRLESEAALRATLETQRSQLDAVIHDHVMTALVAAARSTGPHDGHVTGLANQAVARVQAHGVKRDGAGSFAPVNVEQLLSEAALSASPMVHVSGEVDPAAPMVPQEPARALAQAAREAVLNAEKHADADHISVAISIAGTPGGVRVRVVVRDDGIGFDTAHVSTRRLGIRLSLRERMRTVGGDAEVVSRPGEGTTVVLEWSGGGTPSPTLADQTHPLHPLLVAVSLRPVEALLGLNVLVSATAGLLSLGSAPQPGYLLGAVAMLLISGWLAIIRFGRDRLSRTRATLVVLTGLATVGLGLASLPHGAWSIHQTWFVGGICLISVLLLSGARRLAAWFLALATAVLLLVVAWLRGVPVWIELVVAAEPLAWLIIAEMLLVWMDRIQADLEEARHQSEEASATNAAAFAAVVMREVWLADLQEEFGTMLNKLRDPHHLITDADREECLAMEGRLRDGIKATNLAAPALSSAVMSARMRGIDVTLVDNRGSALEEGVRRAVVRHLVEAVNAAQDGRIVARTAPEGYDEAVTIVQADEKGSTLTKVLNDGTIVVSQT